MTRQAKRPPQPRVIGKALIELAERMTLDPMPPSSVRLEDIYGPCIELDDESANMGTGDAELDDLLRDWPGGGLIGIAPEDIPPEYSPAAFWKLMKTMMALVVTLREDGWYQPSDTARAGQVSALRRRGIRDVRRDLIRGILQRLPALYRAHPTSLLTIERVREELWLLGTDPNAGSSPVLKSCREVSARTIKDDLRHISRTMNGVQRTSE
jgi:hypothetical protein